MPTLTYPPPASFYNLTSTATYIPQNRSRPSLFVMDSLYYCSSCGHEPMAADGNEACPDCDGTAVSGLHEIQREGQAEREFVPDADLTQLGMSYAVIPMHQPHAPLPPEAYTPAYRAVSLGAVDENTQADVQANMLAIATHEIACDVRDQIQSRRAELLRVRVRNRVSREE